MKFARGLLIFSYGLFTIAAQTLLFREFITTFEGNDISVGIFFGSWFLWVAVGAILVYRAKSLAEKLLENIEFLFLGYLPAFILQLILIIQGRELAGIQYYQLLPIRAILLLSIVLNAPLSVITGMLFPIACRWFQQDQQQPVSRVYILEAAGSFVGGLTVTLLLGSAVSSATIFFILALIVSASAFCVQLSRSRKWVLAILPLCISVCLIGGLNQHLAEQLQIIKWTKLLPENALRGAFHTPQAEYLYGIYQNQWVAVRQGSTCETLPDRESAGRIAAIGLCQNPHAKRFLVIGSGLGLCYEFLRLPQTQTVTWAHWDSEYIQKMEQFIPAEFKITDKRLYRLASDARLLLTQKKQFYDLVVLNLPDATSSVLNRYYTLEFYRQVKQALRPGGLLMVRIAGGANIMGTELINLGASTKLTLQKVFSNLVLTPGEDTWFITSDSEKLTGDPARCRDRFAAIEAASRIYPPDALFSIYLPSRAAIALESYSRADLPQNILINRDARPLTHLYSLLLAAKQSGAPVTRLVKHLALAGPAAFIIPVLVFIALRIIYVSKTVAQGRKTGFDSAFLVFSTGWVGIGVVIVLMYLYQTRFGSLYLHIGIISSLFMVGLTIGAILISHLFKPHPPHSLQATTCMFAVLFVHTLILTMIAFWPSQQWTHLAFAMLFILCGLCTGCYFPLAATQLTNSGFEVGQTGSKLETADHIGASVGGVVTSLALVPVLGTKLTLFIFILLVLINAPLAALRMYKPQKSCYLPTITFRLRRLGYILFGLGVTVILCSNLLADAAARLRPSLTHYAAQTLAGQLQIEKQSAVLSESAQKINYFRVTDPNHKLTGYIFSSQDFAPQLRGFGGKMNLAIYVDTTGKLINFHIIRSNETPSYLKLLRQWRENLHGRRLFQHRPFADIDAKTGATITAKAIISALETSGQKFATEILGQTIEPGLGQKTSRAGYLPDKPAIYLIAAIAITLLVIYFGGFWTRLAVLTLNLIIGGLWLNAQYSSEQIATLLALHTPTPGLSGVFLLVVAIPLLVIILGNIFCGYICPFGAAQELLGYLIPRRFKQPLPAEKMQKARFIKYVILFVLVALFFSSRDRTTLTVDPLIEIFSPSARMPLFAIAAIALIGSLFYCRFWCRYLCPTGAFLSILNNLIIFKRYLPPKRFARCEFGLTARDHLDCIYCDRCRYQPKPAAKQEPLPRPHTPLGNALSRYLVAVALVVAIFVSSVSMDRFLKVTGASLSQPAASAVSGGKPRDVDLQRIRTLIEQKRLSDREAEFYKKVD